MIEQLIEQRIHNLLTPPFEISELPPAYYAIAPQSQKPPFMVYTVISEVTADVLCGQNDTTSTIQLDSYSTSPLIAKVHALKALEQLKPLAPATVNGSGSFEEETKLFRYQMEFSVIY